MFQPIQTIFHQPLDLRKDDFVPDVPRKNVSKGASTMGDAVLIDGVVLTQLIRQFDPRGSLSELLTMRDGSTEPIVHVYQVTASAGSIRAWVAHRRQDDRLAFLNGRYRIALYDIRPGSPTFGLLNAFVLGVDQPSLLRIPADIINGVQNLGDAAAFINMPRTAYDPSDPDKRRLPPDDPRVPFRFDE